MAESVFGKPIDTAIQEINDKIGTVPSGETVEGQIDALNSNFNSKLNAGLSFTASSISDFLSQILDYAVSLDNAGSRIVGITWQQHFFSSVTICSQSATRHIATVVPQPANESNIYIAEYNGGTKTYKRIAMTSLS